MTLLGLDFAGGRPGGAAIKAAGYSFTCRYLTPGGPGLPGKLLTAGEYADLLTHGIAVVLNWETTADRMLGGRAVGIADAGDALTTARSLGVPDNRPIFFSADFDATPAQQTQIDAYLQGCSAVIGIERVGIYGGYWTVKRALDNGTARWAWQTGAWSGGNRDPRIHLYQRIGTVTVGGIPCDVNEACQLPDFGQHPCPPSTRGELDMPAGVIPSGQQVTKLVMPIGPSVSQLTAKGWLSLASTENGTAQVWIQGPKSNAPVNNVTLTKDQRWWIELPDGTDQMTIHTNSPGPVGWCLELQPK